MSTPELTFFRSHDRTSEFIISDDKTIKQFSIAKTERGVYTHIHQYMGTDSDLKHIQETCVKIERPDAFRVLDQITRQIQLMTTI